MPPLCLSSQHPRVALRSAIHVRASSCYRKTTPTVPAKLSKLTYPYANARLILKPLSTGCHKPHCYHKLLSLAFKIHTHYQQLPSSTLSSFSNAPKSKISLENIGRPCSFYISIRIISHGFRQNTD